MAEIVKKLLSRIKRRRPNDSPDLPNRPRHASTPSISHEVFQKALGSTDKYIKDYNWDPKTKAEDRVWIQVEGGVLSMDRNNRRATLGFSFCATTLSEHESKILNDAIEHATTVIRSEDPELDIGPGWFSNHAAKVFIPPHLDTTMALEAAERRRIVYRGDNYRARGGLLVLACPLDYSVVTKLYRLAQQKHICSDSTDLGDAADFLHQYLGRYHMLHTGFPETLLINWMDKYQLYNKGPNCLNADERNRLSDIVLPRVNECYMEMYGGDVCYRQEDKKNQPLSRWKRIIPNIEIQGGEVPLEVAGVPLVATTVDTPLEELGS